LLKVCAANVGDSAESEISLGDCPLECDTNFYHSSVFTAKYPTNFYANLLSNQEEIKQKFQPSNTFVPGTLSSVRV